MRPRDYVTREELRRELEAFDERLDQKMDIKLQYWAKKVVEDITAVITDLMVQIDRRFIDLEKRVEALEAKARYR
jgi:hypothetical protein